MDRPTPPNTEGTALRPEQCRHDRAASAGVVIEASTPSCPSWCTGGSCGIGEHESGVTSVPATAGGPVSDRDPSYFPTVNVGAWKYDSELEPYAMVGIEPDGVAVRMRPRELRQLAELALRLAEAMEPVAPRTVPARPDAAKSSCPVQKPRVPATWACPAWCTQDHTTDLLVAGEGSSHNLTLLNDVGKEGDGYGQRLVQVGWAPFDRDAVSTDPYVWLYTDGVEAEMTPDEARSFACGVARSVGQHALFDALQQAARIVEAHIAAAASETARGAAA